MKKSLMKRPLEVLALGAILVHGIPLSFTGCTPSKKPRVKLERVVSKQEIFDFNEVERNCIRTGLNLVKKQGYDLPDIVFIRKKARRPPFVPGTQENNGEYHGLCKNNKSALPGYFNYEKFGNYHLIFIKGMYDHERDSSEDWDSKFPHPMTSTTIHELGHIYYGYLTEKDKQEITDFFTRIDLSLVENVQGLHPGHASNYSYNKYLIRPGMTQEEREKAAEEQAVEFFVRKISDLENQDLKAFAKYKLVSEKMQRFKRPRLFIRK